MSKAATLGCSDPAFKGFPIVSVLLLHCSQMAELIAQLKGHDKGLKSMFSKGHHSVKLYIFIGKFHMYGVYTVMWLINRPT